MRVRSSEHVTSDRRHAPESPYWTAPVTAGLGSDRSRDNTGSTLTRHVDFRVFGGLHMSPLTTKLAFRATDMCAVSARSRPRTRPHGPDERRLGGGCAWGVQVRSGPAGGSNRGPPPLWGSRGGAWRVSRRAVSGTMSHGRDARASRTTPTPPSQAALPRSGDDDGALAALSQGRGCTMRAAQRSA